jgi:hypothetical protein
MSGTLAMMGCALCCAVLALIWRMCNRLPDLDDWEPDELRDAAVIFAEKRFVGGVPPVSVRVDRAYRRRDGTVVLVEFKSRDRFTAHPSDVIELSAQRFAMSRSTGFRISMRAYVVVESLSGRTRRAIPVRLLNEIEVLKLVKRYEALLTRTEEPAAAVNDRHCIACCHRARCHG